MSPIIKASTSLINIPEGNTTSSILNVSGVSSGEVITDVKVTLSNSHILLTVM